MVCRRAGDQITCGETETIGPYPAFSATVENVKIARNMTDSDGVSSGIFIENQSGEEFRFTSSFLDSGQQTTVADRIHQFIFVQADQTELAFTLPVSLFNLGLGAAFVLAMLLWALFSAIRILRRARR